MKGCFLFGSGASVPAGKPTVEQITERILSGDDPSLEPNKTDFDDDNDARLKESRGKLLRWLEIQVKRRYACEPNRPVNYEDLYYLASQIHDDLRGEHDNPAVHPLIEKAFAEMLLSVAQSPGTIEDELKHLAGDAKDYIRHCVMLLLRAELQPLDCLEFVAEASEASSGRGLDILTLNHDTVLERFLTGRGIPVADGFAEETNIVKVRQWQPATLQEGQDVIRLLKLHGGIDWFRFRPHGVQDWSEDYFGIPTEEYLRSSSSLRDDHGRLHDWADQVPFFLIGTFNKFTNYTDSVYLEIYYQAFRSLDEADVLVIVGYGFGDKGINRLITDWIYRNLNRQVVVVDKNPEALEGRARRAIGDKWQDWLKAGRLIPVTIDLENKLSWDQVTRLLL